MPDDFTNNEVRLAARNHAMPLEALLQDITQVGMHYLYQHFDIPLIRAEEWRLSVGGLVERPLELGLDELLRRPAATQAVTLECAGNGRASVEPRPKTQPWIHEAVGTAEWSGTPLGPILREAGIRPDASEAVFTGEDRGVQGGVEHHFERSLPLDDALADGVMLAHTMNGAPLPRQHGFPLRLIVPGWYGVAHVKWLTSITLIGGEFQGYQQAVGYRIRQTEGERGEPVGHMLPRSLMLPPGIPEYLSRRRLLRPGRVRLQGRAWSGTAPVAGVEVSLDGGASWQPAALGATLGDHAWRSWSYEWQAAPGEYEIASRATDASGLTQPLEPRWNLNGYLNNSVQVLGVTVAERAYPVEPPVTESGLSGRPGPTSADS